MQARGVVHLDVLHEPAILHNIRTRFARKQPYTLVGNVLVAVNPF